MNPIDPTVLEAIASEMTVLRRDIHAHPETAFGERRTAALIAEKLAAWGIEVHTGIGRTGVVGVIRRETADSNARAGRCIALRADMDALSMAEANTFSHRSQNEGTMHACGHDGHVAMLLGAAKWLQMHGSFAGTVCLVFQPAEEGRGGAMAMLDDGLMARFPIDHFYGLHNWPGLPAGHFAAIDGPVMAAADEFEIVLAGKGTHAAMPHGGTDPVVAGAALVQAIQSMVTRCFDPLDSLVVSVTRFHAGQANNVIPDKAILGGTVRSFRPSVQEALEASMHRVCAAVADCHGVSATLRYVRGYPATCNESSQAALCRRVVASMGAVFVDDVRSSMGAEDFSQFALMRPSCYAWIGNGFGESSGEKSGSGALHNPYYDFNDAVIATGIRYWVTLAESALIA